jgi:hypothetical protein
MAYPLDAADFARELASRVRTTVDSSPALDIGGVQTRRVSAAQDVAKASQPSRPALTLTPQDLRLIPAKSLTAPMQQRAGAQSQIRRGCYKVHPRLFIYGNDKKAQAIPPDDTYGRTRCQGGRTLNLPDFTVHTRPARALYA